MNLRYLIREIVEQKNIFQEAVSRFNKLTGKDLNFKSKTDYQFIAKVPKKELGAFGNFLNSVEILMTIFNTGAGNYNITFQVYWDYKNTEKMLMCNLNTLKVFGNKFNWIKTEKIN